MQRSAKSEMATAANFAHQRLSYQGSYLCPVCRHGQISGLMLMDAFACNFCHHIFTANLQEQSLQVVDSSQPLVWRWNGQTWKMAHQINVELTWLIWMMGLFLILVPAGITGLMAYILPSADGWWFPVFWTGLTFLLHFTLVFWLLAEHHQFPLYATWKVRLRNWLGQR